VHLRVDDEDWRRDTQAERQLLVDLLGEQAISEARELAGDRVVDEFLDDAETCDVYFVYDKEGKRPVGVVMSLDRPEAVRVLRNWIGFSEESLADA